MPQVVVACAKTQNDQREDKFGKHRDSDAKFVSPPRSIAPSRSLGKPVAATLQKTIFAIGRSAAAIHPPAVSDAYDLARSLLFVPGDRPERFDKAAAAGAGVVVLDLEDAVAPEDKDAARAHVAA